MESNPHRKTADIVVKVTALGLGEDHLVEPATAKIAVSGDVSDAPLAVAQRSQPCSFSYIDEFPM